MPSFIYADLRAIAESLESIPDNSLTGLARERIERACRDLKLLDDALERSSQKMTRALLQAVDEFGEMLRREDPRLALVRKLAAHDFPTYPKDMEDSGPTAVKNAG